jgi:hypothetical protein
MSRATLGSIVSLSRLVPVLVLAVGCAAPDLGLFQNQLDIVPVEGGATVNEAFIEKIDGATERLRVALPEITDVAVSDALIEAFESGVDVRVVTDVDHAADGGAIALADAGVPLKLADSGMTYFEFSLNQDVTWDGTDVLMSEAFVVADGTEIVSATAAGDLDEGWRVLVEGHSEDIGEDLESEHVQLFGGTDASSLTAYNSMAKSIVDARWAYPTEDDVVMELWFGPQERLIKRVIDGAYRARSSIWVLTGQFSDEGLARALQAKSGIVDVQVIVGAEHVTSTFGPSSVLAQETDGVAKARSTVPGRTPTVVIIDYATDPNGYRRTTQAMVLSHSLVSASRLYQDQEVTTDQLIDGTLWVVRELDQPSAELESLVALMNQHLDEAEAF